MPATNPHNNVLGNVLSFGTQPVIYPRVEATFENEWTSGFCDICASYPGSETKCQTCNICMNSCCCHHCTLSALTYHLIGFDGNPEITQMLRRGDEEANEMMAVSCMNRPICCLYGCVDILAFSMVSTLGALQIRHGIRRRYKIKESCLKSTAACMCCFFSLRQIQHELWIHGDLSTAGAFFRAPAPPPPASMIPLPEAGEAERIEEEIRLRATQMLVNVLAGAANRIEERQQQREQNRRRIASVMMMGEDRTTTNTSNNNTQPPTGYEQQQEEDGMAMGVVVDSNENTTNNSDNNNNQEQQIAAVGVPIMS